MKNLLFLSLLISAFALRAAAPPRGDARLRELVVFPEINFDFKFGIQCQNDEYVIVGSVVDLPGAIEEQRGQLKAAPGDVNGLIHLARLLSDHGQTNESRATYQEAEHLCRANLAAHPQDGFGLTTLGRVLDALGKDDEAESAFRGAILVSSNDWRCWVGLGIFLPNSYFYSLFPTNLWRQLTPGQSLSPDVLAYRPAPEALKKAEAAGGEASRCFARARALAPKEPNVLLQRAGYLCFSNWQGYLFRCYRNNQAISEREWVTSFFSPLGADDLKTASDLKPKDFELASLAAYFQCLPSLMQNPAQNLGLETLPARQREAVQTCLTRLEDLSRDADKKTAAGALENLGFLDRILGKEASAGTASRQAVALDPTREEAWDLLTGLLLDSNSPDELLSVCNSRLKAKDSARNRIIVSKVYAQKAGNWSEASRHAEMARRMDTKNVVPPMLLGAIALKRSSQTNSLSIADANLHVASDLFRQMPDNGEKHKRWRELTLDTAILLALERNPEFAKNYVNEVLKHFPDDETAREILKALN